jgi:hypothetical protein
MSEQRLLFRLEYEWRVFRFYRKVMNYLVRRGMSLSSPILCYIKNRLDKHYFIIMNMKRIYEKQTGESIAFYKCDDI